MAKVTDQERLDRLDAAIATGAKKVKYSDKEIQYFDTPSQMMQARNFLSRKMGQNRKMKKIQMKFDKGI